MLVTMVQLKWNDFDDGDVITHDLLSVKKEGSDSAKSQNMDIRNACAK